MEYGKKIHEVDPKRLTRQDVSPSQYWSYKVTELQAEDLILRDFLVSAASLVNAAGSPNGDSPSGLGVSDFSFVNSILDKLCVETKLWVIDLEFLAAQRITRGKI